MKTIIIYSMILAWCVLSTSSRVVNVKISVNSHPSSPTFQERERKERNRTIADENFVVCPKPAIEKSASIEQNTCGYDYFKTRNCIHATKNGVGRCKLDDEYSFQVTKNVHRQLESILCDQSFIKCMADIHTIPINIEFLDVSRNSLSDPEDVMETLAFMKRLFAFDGSRNDFSSLSPNMFGRNSKLRAIKLDMNFLFSLPEDLFHNNPLLLTVSLSGNRLRYLPPKLFQNNRLLKTVEIERNNLVYLPHDLFSHNPSLTSVNLSWNKIKAIPSEFFESNSNLRQIVLSKNGIKNLPEDLFKQTKKVRFISLSHNKLTQVQSDMFKNARDLRVLNLDRNRLETLPQGIFKHNRKLQKLDLSFNKLSRVSPGTFKFVASVKYDQNATNFWPTDSVFDNGALFGENIPNVGSRRGEGGRKVKPKNGGPKVFLG